MIKKRTLFLIICVAVLCISTAQTRAAMMFEYISNNSGLADDIVPQLSMIVTDAGSNQVLFTFYNSGGITASISDIYFDDGSLLGISSIVEPAGVDFETSTLFAPALPQGNLLDPDFVTTAGFWAATIPPPTGTWGVDAGESVGILFNLDSGKTYQNVLAALGQGFIDASVAGSLRIGINVQIPGGTGALSDSFILVPVPAAVLLGILGLGVVGIKLRKYA